MTRLLTVLALVACAVVAVSASSAKGTIASKPEEKLGEIISFDILAKMNEFRGRVTDLAEFTAASLNAPLRKSRSSREDATPVPTFKCDAFAEEFKLNHIGTVTTSTTAAPSPPSTDVDVTRAESSAPDVSFTLSYFEKEGTLTEEDVVNAFHNGITKFDGKAPPAVKDNLSVYADPEAMGFVNLYTTAKTPKVGCWKMTKCEKESVLCKFIPGTIQKTDASGPLSSEKFSEILGVNESNARAIVPSAAALVALVAAALF